MSRGLHPRDPTSRRSLQCEGKTRFATRRAARVGRRNAGAHLVEHLRIYLCRYCRGYHLGHVRVHAVADAQLLELAEVDPEAAHRARLESLYGPDYHQEAPDA